MQFGPIILSWRRMANFVNVLEGGRYVKGLRAAVQRGCRFVQVKCLANDVRSLRPKEIIGLRNGGSS